MSKKDEKSQKVGGRYAMNAKNLGYIALSVAILTVLSWVQLPLGEIPFTLQTLGVFLVAGILGWKRALITVTAYILLGMVGVPVFAGFTGGIAKLVTPTGGYIIGFLFIAFIGGLSAELCKKITGVKSYVFIGLGMLVGLLVCYAFGTVWFVIQAVRGGEKIGVWATLAACVLPFLPFDGIKILIATVLAKRLRNILDN